MTPNSFIPGHLWIPSYETQSTPWDILLIYYACWWATSDKKYPYTQH